MINFDEFMKVDLRIAKIVNAENVEKADKLIKITADLGNDKRTIFAGIKGFYATITMSTDDVTEAGGEKELFSVASKVVKSS